MKPSFGLGLCVSDLNNDNWLDIYIANDFDQDNALLINQEGSGFVDQAESYHVVDPRDGMGLATCDYDNDLDTDFLVTNIKENSFPAPLIFSAPAEAVIKRLSVSLAWINQP